MFKSVNTKNQLVFQYDNKSNYHEHTKDYNYIISGKKQK